MSTGYLTGQAGSTEVWLRALSPVIDPRARLVCLPHAGGTAAFFRPWRDCLAPDVELLGVQYPGRLDRITEACIDDMDVMSTSVASAVRPLLNRPVALFGHSLGAVIAYEVARRLSACPREQRMLAGSFVSGRPAPGRERGGVMHLASDEALLRELARLGGTRAEVLADPELRRAFLPALRSDFRLAERYRPRPGPPLNCPVTVLLGSNDSEVDTAEAQPWAGCTRAGFALRVFPGEHFYLSGQVPAVVRVIMDRLTESTPAWRRDWAGP